MKRCVIYDFDDTLFYSPLREDGEARYFEATGEVFPFPGWWGRKESLMHPVLPNPITNDFWNLPTVQKAREDLELDSKENHIVMMTGRPFKMRNIVKDILNSGNLNFHDYYFRNMPKSKGSDTFEFKMFVIKNWLLESDTEILEIHEDRQEHLSGFMKELKYLKSLSSNNLQLVKVYDAINYLEFSF
jgi:hypothetical protein